MRNVVLRKQFSKTVNTACFSAMELTTDSNVILKTHASQEFELGGVMHTCSISATCPNCRERVLRLKVFYRLKYNVHLSNLNVSTRIQVWRFSLLPEKSNIVTKVQHWKLMWKFILTIIMVRKQIKYTFWVHSSSLWEWNISACGAAAIFWLLKICVVSQKEMHVHV